ncbi:hypothetical protein [Pareuzebyella sediminis]|uniref:hypothetical protein n=1 Tax=Pareuzebyella sediminis TaxID=2607998 RepID=UPI0011F0937D|nr:hypothetical protein [Pareuzebyella sediminis]
MRASFKKSIFWGYLLLLIINVIELRSGILLGVVQLLLGLGVCLPKLLNVFDLPAIRRYDRVIKVVFSLSLLLGIVYRWYNAPNHLFTLFFLSLLLFYAEDEEYFTDNLRWILIVVMGFATMHKVFNPNFMSGDFIAFRVASGDFFRPLIISGLMPEIKEVIAQNVENIRTFVRTDPVLGKTIILNIGTLPYEGLRQPFVYSIIGMELLLALGFVFLDRSKIVLGFLLLFVASIGLVVSEYEFAATLLYMGFVLCPITYRNLKLGYRNIFLLYAFFALLDNLFWR